MRTTLDIEDDVLQAAKELSRRDGGTAGQIISTLARRGLAGSPTKSKNLPARAVACRCCPRAAKS